MPRFFLASQPCIGFTDSTKISGQSGVKYRREIDGLRAVAVLPVIFFHAGFTAFGGGYIGVDIFFVISGYLITTILIADREAGTYSLWRFYERRARRILPALFLVLACCVPFAWMWIPPDPLEDFARSLGFTVLFISNIHFLEHSGYFDVSADLRPLLHTWSLAVEEQFYILFPALLWALGRFRRGKHVAVFALCAVGSIALAIWGAWNLPAENFFFTPSRLWELLAGSICAAILLNRPQMRNEALAALGLALIVGSVFWLGPADPSPSAYTLVPIAGAMLVILFAARETLTARVLSWRPMVGIGLISYSLYLWHQPILAFARIRGWTETVPGLIWGLIALSFALAVLSWAFVERPFRRAGWLPSRQAVFGASLGGIVAFGAMGFTVLALKGVPQRLDGKGPEAYVKLVTRDSTVSRGWTCPGGEAERPGGLCVVHDTNVPSTTIAVLGDSHAGAILPAFDEIAAMRDIRVLRGVRAACPPLLGVYLVNGGRSAQECHDEVQAFAEDAVARGVDMVFLAARWSLYVKGDLLSKPRRFMISTDPDNRRQSDAEWFASFETGLRKTISHYRDAGIRIVILDQVPQQVVLPINVLGQAILRDLPEAEFEDDIARSFVDTRVHVELMRGARTILVDVADDLGADLISVNAFFEREGRYAWLLDRALLYTDADHISAPAARAVAPLLDKALFGNAPM